MKTNLNNKYKDKNPEETIENVKQFFQKKGYTIEEKIINNPIPSVWWCRLILKYNNIEIQGANGKGTSKLFALASGHAELYERYCNLLNNIFSSKINFKKLFDICYKKYGYNLFSDETMISIDEAINKYPNITNYCNSINDNNNSLIKYLNIENPNGVLALPFKGFNTDDVINLPFRLLMETTGSSGMAAGNTIEEALTQGFSELCEHYVQDLIYKEVKPFAVLDINKINCSSYLKEFFKELDQYGYFKYTIFDFSYLYNMPVLGIYVINTKEHLSYLNLGASPIFDIALERCCTELFQGVSNTLGDSMKQIMVPLRSVNINEVLVENERCITLSDAYPDNFILNTYLEQDYNKNIFLENNNYSNKELNEYYKNIFDLNQWEVYYRDFSQDEKIKAIKAYVKNIEIKHNAHIELLKLVPTLIKKRKWNITFKWNELIEQYFKTKEINMQLFHEIQSLKKIENDAFNKPIVLDCTAYRYELFTIPGLYPNEYSFDNFYNNLLKENVQKDYVFSSIMSNYSFLYYFNDRYYSEKELLQIAEAYGIEYTNDDLNNKGNIFYYLDKIYFSAYYDWYNNEKYISLLESFIPWANKSQ